MTPRTRPADRTEVPPTPMPSRAVEHHRADEDHGEQAVDDEVHPGEESSGLKILRVRTEAYSDR